MKIKSRTLYEERIKALLGKGEAVVLTGHRRVGKSCILEKLAKTLRHKGHVVYIDMEDPDNAEIIDYKKLNYYIKHALKSTKHNYILIGEVQEIADFEKTLRYWIKQDNVDVVVTGSNASMLSSEVATAFSGRYLGVHVSSLGYDEFLHFYGLEDSDEAILQYIRWGGLPFLCNIPLDDVRTRTDYLGSIYDTIFVKDIVSRRQIRNVSLLNNLAHFVADNTGQLLSTNSIAKFMKHDAVSVSQNTIADYMNALCDTYMIDRVMRYDIRSKRLFEQQEKYYFEDIGIRNYLCKDKRLPDLEKVMENLVYLKLKNEGNEVYVGQFDGKEIDFVTRHGDEIAYYQVTLSISNPETYEREFGNLKKIRDNYPKSVITLDHAATLVSDSGIRVLHLRDFLLR